MKRCVMFRTVLFLCLLFISCAHKTPEEKRIEELKAKVKASPHLTKKYWDSYRNIALEDRLFETPKEVIDFIHWDNQIYGFDSTPKRVVPTVDQKRIFKQVIKEFPAKLKKKMEESLVAVFLVEDLGTSALTEAIKELPKESFMVFDLKVFQKKANDWCNWKERTPFKEGAWKLDCKIRNQKENGSKEAFQYIFTHELAHVINRADTSLTSFWFDKFDDVEIQDKPFQRISWKKGKSHFDRIDNNDILNKVVYYNSKKALPNSKMNALYQILQDSRFPSLYGTINPWDDFAEAFVITFHTQVLKKPFSVTLRKGSKKVVFKSCIQTGACPQKRELMMSYFK